MHSEAKQTVHHLTERDLRCLTWIAMQYASRLDQLQRLLFRSTPDADRSKLKPGTDHLSLDRTYELIGKWLTLGLIEKQIILHGDKLWLWLHVRGCGPASFPSPTAANRPVCGCRICFSSIKSVSTLRKSGPVMYGHPSGRSAETRARR